MKASCQWCGNDLSPSAVTRRFKFCSADCSNEMKRSFRSTPLTQERLRSLLRFDPQTGLFLRMTSNNQQPIGSVAGSVDDRGYRKIRVDGRMYRASRLVWFFVHGRWPPAEIDHRNLNRNDDRYSNLREATDSQQKANSSVYRNNLSGLKGVRRKDNRWQARIRKDGTLRHLGIFDTPEQAHAAYLIAANELFGEFARAA